MIKQSANSRRKAMEPRLISPLAWLLGCALWSSSCSETIESPSQPPTAHGTYALVSYLGSPLPRNIFPMITPDGRDTGCWLQVTEGTLILDSLSHTFSEQLIERSSCDQQILSNNRAVGKFTQLGTRVNLILTSLEYFGILREDSVEVHFNDLWYSYKKQQ